MKDTPIKIPKVIEDLREIFEVEKGLVHGTTESDGQFMISKRQWKRHEVIEKLQKYFENRVVYNGYVEVTPMTFIHTTFMVKSIPVENEQG